SHNIRRPRPLFHDHHFCHRRPVWKLVRPSIRSYGSRQPLAGRALRYNRVDACRLVSVCPCVWQFSWSDNQKYRVRDGCDDIRGWWPTWSRVRGSSPSSETLDAFNVKNTREWPQLRIIKRGSVGSGNKW